MDARLDPGCEGARALETQQREQTTLLAGGEGALATVVRQTHDRQILAHVGGCARCSTWKNACCPECNFDVRNAPHGWRCPRGKLSWTDFLPWNIRARRAPPRPTGAPRAPPAAAATATDGRSRAPRTPPAPPPRRAVSPPAAKPAPSPLAHAYAVLGVTSSASPDEVRKAFRERAQQYHPDKVAHMAPEFREMAEQKMKQINDAYARIKRAS